MNILYVTRDYPPHPGGMERRAAALGSALGALGHDVTVLAPNGSTPQTHTSLREYWLLPHWRAAGYHLRSCISTWCKKTKPDAIIANTWSPCGWAAGNIAGRLGIPVLITAHGLDVREPLRKPRLRELQLQTLCDADRIVCVSRDTLAHLAQTGLNPDKLVIVPNGVDTDLFRPDLDTTAWRRQHHLQGKRFLLTVARLVPHKGHDLVLQALEKLPADRCDLHYAIIGDGPYREHLQAHSSALGLHDRVHWLGALPDSELPAAYAASELIVMPSRADASGNIEGFGIAYLEGAAAGKPIIGSTIGGARDAIVDGTTGVLVKPDDAGALATVIRRLYDDVAGCRAMGAAGRRRCEEQFAWHILARRLAGIIEECRQ